MTSLIQNGQPTIKRGWSKYDALREQKKPRVRHMIIPWFLSALKSWIFGKIQKIYVIDSTLWNEFKLNEATCKSHVSR